MRKEKSRYIIRTLFIIAFAMVMLHISISVANKAEYTTSSRSIDSINQVERKQITEVLSPLTESEPKQQIPKLEDEKSALDDIKVLDTKELSVIDQKVLKPIAQGVKTKYNFTYNNSQYTSKLTLSQTPHQIVESYTLTNEKLHAISFRFPKGVLFEYSFDGTVFMDIVIDSEGLPDQEYDFSNIIYVPDYWNGHLEVKSSTSFNFTVFTIPDSHSDNFQSEFSTQTISTQSYDSLSYSGAIGTSLNIIPRSVWGANTSNWDPYSSSSINDVNRLTWDIVYFNVEKIVVHHTATPYTVDPSQAIRDIYLYHAYSRGWGDIGYNYLIDQNGNIYEGKLGGEEVYSYHAYWEANASSISIALVGDFTTATPTAAAKDSLAKLIAEKSILHDIPVEVTNGSESDWTSSTATLFGHRSSYFWCYSGHTQDYRCPTHSQWMINATACPGNAFYPILTGEVTTLAQQYANGSTFENLRRIVTETKEAPSNTEIGVILLSNHQNLQRTDLNSLFPTHSGMTKKSSFGSIAMVTIEDWNNGGSVPHVGWTGSNTPIYAEDLKWKDERAKTLTRIFMLNDDWESVSRNYKYDMFRSQ